MKKTTLALGLATIAALTSCKPCSGVRIRFSDARELPTTTETYVQNTPQSTYTASEKNNYSILQETNIENDSKVSINKLSQNNYQN